MKFGYCVIEVKRPFQMPLVKNAIFLILTSGSTSVLGFFFWILVARLYSPSQVGLATATIAAASLLGAFSKLGLDFGLIRFLPLTGEKNGMLNSTMTITGLFAIFLSVIFIFGLKFWSPSLSFLQSNLPITSGFIIFTAIYALFMLQTSAFVGTRAAKYALLQSLCAGLIKIPLPFLFIASGMIGIFLSWGLASLLALTVSLFFLMPKLLPGYLPLPVIKRNHLKTLIRFSIGNYVADIFDILPGLIFPLIIINTLPEEFNAYFFIAWTIATLLFMVPISINSSLLAEASYEPEKLRNLVIRSITFTLLLLVPGILIIWFAGDKILLFFGKEYSQGSFELLKMLSISSIPYAVVRLYVTIKRVKLQIQPIITTYVLIAAITVFGGYYLISSTGLQGIGIAWTSSQCILAVATGLILLKKEERPK